MLVIRVAGGHRAQGGLRLDVHEALVVVDVVDGLGAVHHFPDDDGGDLDRAAFKLVDLEPTALEIAHSQTDLLRRVERVVPTQARFVDGAHIFAEQTEHGSLVGFDHVETTQADQQHQTGDHSANDQQRIGGADAANEQGARAQQGEDDEQQDRDARQRGNRLLSHDSSPRNVVSGDLAAATAVQ